MKVVMCWKTVYTWLLLQVTFSALLTNANMTKMQK